VSDYETEEQQVEALKEWWKENGKSVVLGVVLGVGAIFSWRGWVSHQENLAVEASDLYAEVVDFLSNDDLVGIEKNASILRSEYADTTFASMASLAEAKLQVEHSELARAVEKLQWVVENSDLDEFKNIALLRKARVLLANGQADDALKALPKTANLAFKGLFAEVRGDIYLSKGDKDKARQAYTEASASGSSDPQLLGMKLDDLAIPLPVDTSKDES
jgi:predicted negative regulator of RcsB-dependent stress response